MPDPSTLAAWVAGALDAARSAEVRDAVAADASLRATAQRLRAEADAPLPDDDGWRMPLPRGRARPMAMMGPPAVGDPLVLDVPAGDGRLVVLHRCEGGWEQVLPAPGAPPIDAGRLNPRRVLVVPDRPGVHDWAVIVAPSDVADVQQAVASGAVPVVRVRAEVG